MPGMQTTNTHTPSSTPPKCSEEPNTSIREVQALVANYPKCTPEALSHTMNNEDNDAGQISNEPIIRSSSHANSILEHYGHWLLSIPRDDIPPLLTTPEYKAFAEAFRSLECAHRKALLHNQRKSQLKDPSVSFLQHLEKDDIILRIFEFLPCATLVKTSETCHRFHILCKQSAKQRTAHMDGHFYLESEMKLLRAKEQIEGIIPDHKPVVRVPLLGLQRRVYVTGSGDPEFNGIYFCTGSNGNGFLFTKPRNTDEWTTTRQDMNMMEMGMEMELDNDHHHNLDNVAADAFGEGIDIERIQHNLMIEQRVNLTDNNDDGEETYPGRISRCIISKRFSNETILWYMSKEIIDETGKIKQLFSFWAKLMVIGEASPDCCTYPSQTSILSRNGEPAWQSLSSNRTTTPPIVELLD